MLLVGFSVNSNPTQSSASARSAQDQPNSPIATNYQSFIKQAHAQIQDNIETIKDFSMESASVDLQENNHINNLIALSSQPDQAESQSETSEISNTF